MTMQRTAWLFTKDGESVRLEIVDTNEGVQLVIEGPSAHNHKYDFPAGTAMEGFRREYEDKLLADGYRLQAVAERRLDVERRTVHATAAGSKERRAGERRRGRRPAP